MNKVNKYTKAGHVSIDEIIIYIGYNIIIFHQCPIYVVEISPTALISEGG